MARKSEYANKYWLTSTGLSALHTVKKHLKGQVVNQRLHSKLTPHNLRKSTPLRDHTICMRAEPLLSMSIVYRPVGLHFSAFHSFYSYEEDDGPAPPSLGFARCPTWHFLFNPLYPDSFNYRIRTTR